MPKSLKIMLIACLIPLFAGCASTTNIDGEKNPDPWEGFNRKVFGFNNVLDRYLLKPAAQGYRYVTPNFIERGVSNFFSNISEFTSLINAGLQGKGKKTLQHSGRFLVNSTVGILGLFDVAKYTGLEKQDGEDFGQTLAVWGVNSGPYLVLPIFGPSTVRGGVSLPVNMATDPLSYYPTDSEVRLGLGVLKVIDLRASLLDAEKLIQGDRYIFLRDAYLQRRQFLINDGKIVDDFGGDDFGGEFGEQGADDF